MSQSTPSLAINRPKFPLLEAGDAACQIVNALRPQCERIEIAGSIRRQKQWVGDIEIVYIPSIVTSGEDLLGCPDLPHNLFDETLDILISAGRLEKRRNKLGSETWGLDQARPPCQDRHPR